MPDRAHVTSVDALESFRAGLIVYLSKARPALEEVSAEVQRTRSWLEHDQRSHWSRRCAAGAGSCRRRRRRFSARSSPPSARRARWKRCRPPRQAGPRRSDAKLRTLSSGTGVRQPVSPLVKQMEKLHTVLTNDMVQAVAYLTEAIRTLDAYAGAAPPSAGGAAPAAAAGPQPEGQP